MSVTRRTFLGTAGASLISGDLLRADDEPRVRVAVIGSGARGSDLIRALTTIDGVEIAGVCDDYPPHLEQGAKYTGGRTKTFADYRKMLDDLKPQAVVIAVPLYLHYQIAADCLSVGCDVFLEKTMCYTITEAKKLVRQVAASKRVFQIGLQRRANPIYKQAQAMIASWMIGQVTSVKAQWHRNNSWRRPVPVPKSDTNWGALEKRLNWRLYKAFSAGLMAELGSHQLDVVNWFFGRAPKRVFACGGIDYYRDGREVLDNISCTYEYEIAPPRNEIGAKPHTVRVSYTSICNGREAGMRQRQTLRS